MKSNYSLSIILLAFLSICGVTFSQNLWEPSGINGGATSTFLKVTDDVFLAGYVAGGLYRSTDGGENWYSISESVDNIGVFVLAISSSGDIYAGTPQSIYKSTDQGINWNKVGSSLPNSYAEDIAFDNSGNIYVTNSYDGVYKSTDGGDNWTLLNNGLPLSRYMYRIEFTSNNILFVSDMYRGIYKSTDFGLSWVQSNIGLDTTYYINNITSNSSGVIFITTAGDGPFKSTDNGNSWVSIQGDLSLPYTADIDFTSSGDLYITIIQQLYKSTNGGVNWTNITTTFNGFAFQSAFVDNNDNVWATSLNSGVIKSTDGGTTWNNYTIGLTSTDVSSLVADASGNLFASIPGKGLYSSTDNGNNWNKISITNYEEDTYIVTVESIPSGGLIVYNVYNGIKISTDLSTWNPFNTGLTNQAIRELAVSNDYYFAAGWDGKIFRSPRSVADWVEITDTLNSDYASQILVSSTGILYYVYEGGVVKSTNSGDDWIDIGKTIDGYKFSIAEHPNGDIFVGTSNGVFRSTNAGNSWTEDESGLYDGALSLDIHNDGSVFAGGYGSTNRSNDLGQTWIPFVSGMENCRIIDLAFGSGDVLFAVAERMGVYRTTTAITSVEENQAQVLNNFSLEQNYPNPFNPSTRISWRSPVSGWQSIRLYNSLGKEIETIVNEYLEAGYHSVLYNVNSSLPSGVYFYKLQTGTFSETKKMILLK